MREEKQYLVEEVKKHLEKSEYFFLADFRGITVSEVAQLRSALRKHSAEYRVVKNTTLSKASGVLSLPNVDQLLAGQTALVVGGSSPSDVAKVLINFGKSSKKCAIKGGRLAAKVLTSGDVTALSALPSLEVCRAQLLGVLNAPAQSMVRVLAASQQGLLNVLNAKSQQQ